MLIDHDFDLDGALVDAAAEVPGSVSTARRPGGCSEPSPEIVIIESHRGFAHGTLALAVIALVLSATTKLCSTHPPNAEPIIHHAWTQRDDPGRPR